MAGLASDGGQKGNRGGNQSIEFANSHKLYGLQRVPPNDWMPEILKMVLPAVSKGNLRKSQAGYFRNRDGILPPETPEYKKEKGHGQMGRLVEFRKRQA